MILRCSSTRRRRWCNSAGSLGRSRGHIRDERTLRFLLTHELQPLLASGDAGRVINVTGPSPDRLNFDDLMAETTFDAFRQFRATNAPTSRWPSNWRAGPIRVG